MSACQWDVSISIFETRTRLAPLIAPRKRASRRRNMLIFPSIMHKFQFIPSCWKEEMLREENEGQEPWLCWTELLLEPGRFLGGTQSAKLGVALLCCCQLRKERITILCSVRESQKMEENSATLWWKILYRMSLQARANWLGSCSREPTQPKLVWISGTGGPISPVIQAKPSQAFQENYREMRLCLCVEERGLGLASSSGSCWMLKQVEPFLNSQKSQRSH